ncbi:hypothetical protein [[Erwinia] mediterraneensis]|uniref:hypothetical protein n=1 Tax=[Erwinia] mediterraneensis TaxID=2161819 RepID=UPI00102F3663|nr:hypothetical protein [[Erwinia] mediterraneensis]
MSHADILDEASEREQQLIAIALANRPKPGMTFTGKCHYCEEPISKGHYCSAECREDHSRVQWAQKQRGVV